MLKKIAFQYTKIESGVFQHSLRQPRIPLPFSCGSQDENVFKKISKNSVSIHQQTSFKK